jgi:hypothetical protein
MTADAKTEQKSSALGQFGWAEMGLDVFVWLAYPGQQGPAS